MADAFDDRRKALEEDYFHRKDRETLARLRESMGEAAKARGEAAATLACPRCDGRLHEVVFDDISIDRCDRCEGVWLDAGELKHIIGKGQSSGGWLSALWPGRAGKQTTE
ncbi:MAG TPA: zf-TFIIB domain-containing protein [Pyrinomonadaceae bacterium]